MDDKRVSDISDMLFAPTCTGPIGDNRGPLFDPDAFSAMKEKVTEWSDAAGEWLDRGKIDSEEEAGQVADLVRGATKIQRQVETARKDAKEPHLVAGRKIDEAFKSLIDPLERVVKRVVGLQTAWLQAKRDMEEAVRLRRAEEDRKAIADAEAARAAAEARNDIIGEVEAENAIKAASRAADISARPVKVQAQSASGGARAMGLRKTLRARIVNLSLAFMAVRDDPRVYEAIQAALNARLRSKDFVEGTLIPGVEIEIEERAA